METIEVDGEARTPKPASAEGAPAVAPRPAPEPPPPPRKRRVRFVRLGIAAAVVIIAAVVWWLHARLYEDTDDAQIDGNITSVSPRVAGTVIAVHVVDNQSVKAGDVLVELDPTDFEVALAQAKANVAQAAAGVAAESPNVPITETSNRAALRSAEADVESARTDLEAAQRELDQAEANDRLARIQLARAKVLVQGNSMAPADYDQRVAAAEVAAAAASAARQRLEGRRARLAAAAARRQEVLQNAPRQVVTRERSVGVRAANLELAEAQLRQAQLNLSYAKIVAPADGVLGKVTANVGERVQPGQQLVPLTETGHLWVTANFRETQIEHMHPGQHARVHVDAISRDFEGVVVSFAGATGSRYSLLPPENATGNYVKVVQRLPVRIELQPGQPDADRLRPGMSVEPKVKVR